MWLSEQTATPAGLHFQAKQKLWSYDAAGSGAGGNAIEVSPTLDGVRNDVYPFARRCHKLCSRRYRSGVSWRGGRAFGEPEAGGEIKLAGCKHRKLRNLNMVVESRGHVVLLARGDLPIGSLVEILEVEAGLFRYGHSEAGQSAVSQIAEF